MSKVKANVLIVHTGRNKNETIYNENVLEQINCHFKQWMKVYLQKILVMHVLNVRLC